VISEVYKFRLVKEIMEMVHMFSIHGRAPIDLTWPDPKISCRAGPMPDYGERQPSRGGQGIGFLQNRKEA
jgi:hypothetical protein